MKARDEVEILTLYLTRNIIKFGTTFCLNYARSVRRAASAFMRTSR